LLESDSIENQIRISLNTHRINWKNSGFGV
jgi:hypothetical protein